MLQVILICFKLPSTCKLKRLENKDMIFVKSFTQAIFQWIWKFTRRMRKPRHFLPPKPLFLAFESQKCNIHPMSSWNMYSIHVTKATLSITSKNLWNYTRNLFTMRNFTQSWNKFTQALLVILVTNIKSGKIWRVPAKVNMAPFFLPVHL